MIYILLMGGTLIFLLTLLVISLLNNNNHFAFPFQHEASDTSARRGDNLQQNINGYFNLFNNRRKYIRIPVLINCLVEFKEFENKKLEPLKNKKFDGNIEDLSLGGVRLNCKYNIPIQDKVIVRIKFQLEGEEVTLSGMFVRKEEQTKLDVFTYGLKFQEISPNLEGKLSTFINKMQIKNHKTVS